MSLSYIKVKFKGEVEVMYEDRKGKRVVVGVGGIFKDV